MFDDDQTVVFFNGIDGQWHSLVEGASKEECVEVEEILVEVPPRRRPAGTEAPLPPEDEDDEIDVERLNQIIAGLKNPA